MKKLTAVDWMALIFVIVGGVNLGFLALFNTDLIALVLGDLSLFSRAVYSLVALSAVYIAVISIDLSKA